jgi:hypothetical protein
MRDVAALAVLACLNVLACIPPPPTPTTSRDEFPAFRVRVSTPADVEGCKYLGDFAAGSSALSVGSSLAVSQPSPWSDNVLIAAAAQKGATGVDRIQAGALAVAMAWATCVAAVASGCTGTDDGAPASCMPVVASDYDQSCDADTDCVGVGEAPECPLSGCWPATPRR